MPNRRFRRDRAANQTVMPVALLPSQRRQHTTISVQTDASDGSNITHNRVSTEANSQSSHARQRVQDVHQVEDHSDFREIFGHDPPRQPNTTSNNANGTDGSRSTQNIRQQQGEIGDVQPVRTINKQIEEWSLLDQVELEDRWDPDHWTASLYCSVCFELHVESFVLQCGHTWCNTCIQAMIKSEKQRTPRRPLDSIPVVCPSCRHSQLYGQYSRYAPRNRALEDAVEAWRQSPDRAKLFALKLDRCIQANMSINEVVDTASQTKPWPPKKKFASVGQQVALPASGESIGTQTAHPHVRDSDAQTTHVKHRVKSTQTMFTRTRNSGVQTTLPTTRPPTPRSRPFFEPPIAKPPISPTDAALVKLIDAKINAPSKRASLNVSSIQTTTATKTLSLPSPPSQIVSGDGPTEQKKSKKNKRLTKKKKKKKNTEPGRVGPWLPCRRNEFELEYYVGDDAADVMQPLLQNDVQIAIALAFIVVFDWRHLVSAFVPDVPMTSEETYYTSYTVDMLTDCAVIFIASFLCFCCGALCFMVDFLEIVYPNDEYSDTDSSSDYDGF